MRDALADVIAQDTPSADVAPAADLVGQG